MTNQQQHELIPLRPGELLQQTRKQKGGSLESVAAAIKVRPEILASIEAGDTGHIPAVYLKGYIRGYARELGIPSAEIEQILQQAQCAEPTVQAVFKKVPPRNPIDRWFKSTSYVLASAVIIALVWQFTTEAVRFSQGDPVLHPEKSAQTPATPARTDTDIDGPGQKPETQQTQLPAQTHLRASIASLNLNNRQNSNKTPLVAESAWAAVGSHEASASQEDALASPLDALKIIISADSWVEITDRDGEKLEMDLLRAGSQRSYSGSAPFRMMLGRASSVEVFHNGEKIDLAPYTRGNVARLTLGTDEDAAEPATATDSSTHAMEISKPDQG